MELKAGEVHIPEGWREVTVEDLKAPTDNALSTGPFGSSIGSRFFEPHGVPVIRGSNLATDGSTRLIDDGFVFVSDAKAHEFRRSMVTRGDLVFTCWGTINQVGLIGPRTAYSRYVISNKQMKFTADEKKADGLFLFYLFSGPELQRAILDQGIGSSVPGFNLGQLRALRLKMPPLPEQRAIAEALGDVDALLGALTQLIAKKRNLKQAAMQQLLTGQTRLPGFSGKWEMASLDQIVGRATGFWGAPTLDDSHPRFARIIRAGDISPDGELTATAPRFLSEAEFSRAQCRLDDLVITTSGNGLGKVWWCGGREDVAASNFVRVLRPRRDKTVGRFLSYTLRSEEGLRQLQEHTATSAYPNLRPTYFAAQWIPLPPVSEQTVVAVFLSDIDAELTALQQRLAKTRALKQGMMQELLTGRTRLI